MQACFILHGIDFNDNSSYLLNILNKKYTNLEGHIDDERQFTTAKRSQLRVIGDILAVFNGVM